MNSINIQHLIPKNKISNIEISSTLGDEIVLCKNGNIVFHWADFHETCENIKENLDFTKKEAALSFLKRITIWIRAHNKIHKTSMYDLYEKFIVNKTELVGGVGPFEELEMSFISSTGPFKKMSVADTFNKDTYREFVELFLVRGALPKRDYRIRLKSKILFEFGKNFQNAELISLEQLTSRGMLFSLDAEVYKKKLIKEKSFRILLDSTVLREAKNKNLQELKSYFGNYSFNLLYSAQREDALEVDMTEVSAQSSFDFHKYPKVFLFISYSKMSSNNPLVLNSIIEFVEQTKELVRSHYQEIARSA